ncbi:MAG: hypothetical protein ACD_42C00559G0002 [uncultured bacterium]|nr:MAG: hypothetical protein ACD_42C00559G0002 [uncultured bacterium]OGT25708.1 MAG: hypothetical protein A3B71_01060 [Gammaproteobacteria bacterium RIFCSPHIGHO2_02_FULL_42_43]OGT27498.1 MAG: hypothetical protein A2624_00250 [Gammaproteobacteria bacterium RIFCSPHIGHO2_01_FULL_42_8]OGT51656.1 MAG: hypothetical protein A3E54_03275 [Gammaproteobacteria bacterium RIFCSPHIGHO2_12_FULL_41_25]OGT61554.1 MAG: hypothetical protein A3I77_03080 [Gammaproteobacteria bacterium RIFCSPLOWO2_02_FULL_42_14]OGT
MAVFQIGKYKTFGWKGTNKWQQKAKGFIIAEDIVAAEEEIKKMDITITLLKPRSYWMLPKKVTQNIKTADMVYIMRQLSTLIKAGIPLVQSLEIISNGADKIRLRGMMLNIRDSVIEGKTFAESLALYPKLFSSLICGLISAGEQSGTLDRIVNEIATFLEHQEYLKNRVKRALYYPITLFSAAILICVGMLLFLVPRFETIYKGFHAKLPAFTQSFVDLSHFVKNRWYIIIIVAVLICYGIMELKKRSPRAQYFISAMSLHIILFGKLIQKAIISRVSMTLAITLSAGIPLIDALERIADVAGNVIYRDALMQTREEVMQGKAFALSLKSTQLFPSIVTQMIEVGEKSGELDHMLTKVAEYYRDQVNTAVEGLTTLIEPLLIITLGLIIGLFVIAMYLPIFNLGMAIK